MARMLSLSHNPGACRDCGHRGTYHQDGHGSCSHLEHMPHGRVAPDWTSACPCQRYRPRRLLGYVLDNDVRQALESAYNDGAGDPDPIGRHHPDYVVPPPTAPTRPVQVMLVRGRPTGPDGTWAAGDLVETLPVTAHVPVEPTRRGGFSWENVGMLYTLPAWAERFAGTLADQVRRHARRPVLRRPWVAPVSYWPRPDGAEPITAWVQGGAGRIPDRLWPARPSAEGP